MSYLFAPEALDTPSFTLRCYMPGDGPMLTEAVNASTDHLSPWMPWASPNQTEALSEQLVRQFRGRYLLAQDFVLAIVAPESSAGPARLLGGTGFHLRGGGLEAREAEIGMWIRADAAGRGLGTEVLGMMIAWGFDAWPWQRLEWRCDGRNVASIRTAQKAGMVQEAVLRQVWAPEKASRRDTFIFAALKAEHEESP